MSTLGHGRLATLHDLHTVMPKHAVAYINTCLEINKYVPIKGISTGTESGTLANKQHAHCYNNITPAGTDAQL